MKENIESPKNTLFVEMKISKLIDYLTCVEVAKKLYSIKENSTTSFLKFGSQEGQKKNQLGGEANTYALGRLGFLIGSDEDS